MSSAEILPRMLSIEALSKTVADDRLNFIFLFFIENTRKTWHFM